MADDIKIEDLLKGVDDSGKGREDELAILKMFNGENTEESDNGVSSGKDNKIIDQDIGIVLEEEIPEELFINEEDELSENDLYIEETEELNTDIIPELISIEEPVEVSIDSEIEENDILEEFLKKEKQVVSSKTEKEVPKEDFFIQSFKDEGNRKINRLKNIVDSFLELFISKKGRSMHITSRGELYFILDGGSVEKEINNEFNYKAIYSFADYINSRVEMEILDNTGVLKKLYNYRKNNFRFYTLKNDDQISMSFEKIEGCYDAMLKITEMVPFKLMFSKYRGTVNILSGFKPEYSQTLCSVIMEKYITTEKNVVLLYDDDSFSYNSTTFHFSKVRLDKNQKHILNTVSEMGSIVLIYAPVIDEYINIAQELAFAGKNVFYIISGKNSCGDIIEFFLYNINTAEKRRIFSKYLNTIISVEIFRKNNDNNIPVFDFIFLDRKLKRNLFDGKIDVFFRETAEDSGDRIIRFEKMLSKYAQENIIDELEVAEFVRSFSWTIE